MGWSSPAGLVVVALSGGCPSSAASTVAPTSAPAATAPADTPPGPPIASAPRAAAAAEPEALDFTMSISNRCPEPWQATLVRRDKAQPRSGTGRFAVTQDARTLPLRPGDSLVLTNKNGGIMALDFDDAAPGEVVVVEVLEDCSGVNKTTTRGGARR